MQAVVVDLSHWDPASDYTAVKNAGIVGVIFKATQGQSYNDPTYKSQRDKAKAAGLRWGAYHFGDGTSVAGQVNNFVNFANLGEDELFCLDWEDSDNNMSRDQAQQFIADVEFRLNRSAQCVLYSGNRAKDVLGSSIDPFFGKRRLWLAQYSTTAKVQASWETYWLWQFTDGQVGPLPHTVPGVGHCDINSYDGPTDKLIAEWATGAPGPVPKPAPQVATVTITIASPANVKVVVNQQES